MCMPIADSALFKSFKKEINMKQSLIKISAALLAMCIMTNLAGCRKNPGSGSGHWISDRAYYYYDENGNWVEVSDDFFQNRENGENGGDTASGSNTGAVDSSKYQTLIDYCGNDGFDKVFDKKNLAMDNLYADVLEDDWRFRKFETKDGNAYVTYKVDGIAEFYVEYSYGATDRNANKITFLVSKDNINWTQVKAQDEIYMPFNGDSWIRTRAYFGDINPENQYLKINIDDSGATVFNPNINMVQINGLTEKVLEELGAYNSKITAKSIYIDSKNGKDTNSGTSEGKPLKTLYAASKKVYSPGSRILLKAGQEYSGSLTIIGSGSKTKPITVTSYGSGAKPVINARGGAAIETYGEHLNFTGIKITNKTGKNGIAVISSKPGASSGIHITNCDFQNINESFNYTSHDSSAVLLKACGREPNWFDGVTVENNSFKKVARCGVVVQSDWTAKVTNQEWGGKNDVAAGEWFGNKNVAVRNNKLDEIGGDGIILFGCEGGLVEKNVVSNSGLFRNQGEIHWVAIWCHSCNDCIFQYNEVYGNTGKNNGQDLQAFDSDIANKNCVFQYNYSHDNEGGFMLICANDAKNNAQTTGTVVRYNLSVNDGRENGYIFEITSSCYDSQIYNNTVYTEKFSKIKLANFVNYDGGANDSRNTVFTNNIFYAKKGVEVTYNFERLVSAAFNNNVFYNITAPNNGKLTVTNSITDDPRLVSAGATGNGLEAMAAKYAPESGSGVLSRGIAIANNGGKDMLGKKAGDNLIGAIQG